MTINNESVTERPLVITLRLAREDAARLRALAMLRDSNVTQEVRHAIRDYLAAALDDPQVRLRREDVLHEIETQAAQKRAAIDELFGGPKA